MRALLLLPLLALGCADEPAAPPVVRASFVAIEGAVARPAPAGGTTAVFFDLVNPTAAADTLVAVRVPDAARAELHRTVDRGEGMTGMEPVGAVPVPAGETVSLAPSGLHVMAMGLARALTEGDSLDVTVELAGRGGLGLRVPVRFPE